MIVWGHNLHIGRYNATILGANAMGKYLDSYFSSHYFNIAFDTYEGKVNNIVNDENDFKIETHEIEKPTSNFTELFSKVKKPNFYIYLKGETPIAGIQNTITNIYSDWRKPFTLPVKFDEHFDALIFVKKTTESEFFLKLD